MGSTISRTSFRLNSRPSSEVQDFNKTTKEFNVDLQAFFVYHRDNKHWTVVKGPKFYLEMLEKLTKRDSEQAMYWYDVLEQSCCYRRTIQSTLVISNSKGLSKRDIRISTYQICRIEETLIRLTTFNKYMCNWTLEIRDILKILWKRGEIA